MSDQAELAARPDDPVTSLEIRWMFPGKLGTAVAAWFGRFPAKTQAFEDIYLLDPALPGLSVKVRSGQAFEVKAYRGSRGILEVTGRARGTVQSWQKWSFPLAPHDTKAGLPGGWMSVVKARQVSHFGLVGGQAVTGDPPPAGRPACSVELTQARAHGQHWWTIGLEATGPDATLRTILQATATLVFDRPLPGQARPGPENAFSYPHWLTQADAGTGKRQ
jgi:hypothetical protein